MPSWKKILISGSAGELSSLYAPSITGSLRGTASYATYAETASISNSTTLTQLLVLNQAGFTINKGAVVRITGSNNASDIPRITTASYIDDDNSANTLGIVSANITNGSQGYVITEGVLTGINTTGWSSGTLLFLGATGSITGAAPQAPLHAVRLGQVIREQTNQGSIHIRVDNGYELNELHDITDNTTTSSYGDLLIKSGSVWINSRQLTGSYALTGSLIITGSTTADLIRLTQTGTGNVLVVEDSTNPDATPFLIDTSGNVSIGTTGSSGFVTMKGVGANGVTLDTDGQTGNDFQSTRLFWKISGSGNDISIRNLSGSFLFSTLATANGSSGTAAMIISASGNVGIGTTTTSAQLHVNTTGTESLRLSVNGTAGLPNTLQFYSPPTDSTSAVRAGTIYSIFDGVSYTNARLSFQSMTSGNVLVDTMHLKNGNVGIGTTSPTAKFDVSGSAKFSHNGTTAYTIFQNDNEINTYAANGSASAVYIQYNVGATTNIGRSGIVVNTNTTGTSSNGVNVTSDTKVGIGTAVPTEKLQVAGNIKLLGTGSTNINIESGAGVRTYLASDGAGTSFGSLTNHNVTFYRNNAEFARITSTGLGIGTTTPSASLHVVGNTLITGSLTVGSSSIGPNENTLTLGARDNGSEGGQLGLNAPGGTYTSASMIDNYQNRFRILRGTNAGSDAEYFNLNLHSGQVTFNKYTGSGAFTGTAIGYLAFDASGNILTSSGSGTAVNIGNSNLSITTNQTRVLSHSGTSRLIISKSLDSNSVLELDNATTSNSRMLFMKSKLNGESQRDSVRIVTAGGNNADDPQFNGWMNEHIIEYVSGSEVIPNKLKGWSWSYYTILDDGYTITPIYRDVLLISTSNAATLNASLTVSGSTFLSGTTQGSYGNVILIDTGSGRLYYTASSAIGGGSSTSAFPYTGSARITGSLGVTGSAQVSGSLNVIGSTIITGSTSGTLVRITQTGAGNAFVVEDSANPDISPFVIDSSGSVGIGVSTISGPSAYNSRLVSLADNIGTSGVYATGFDNHAIIGLTSTADKAGVYGYNIKDSVGAGIGVLGYSSFSDTPYSGQEYIGGKFEAAGDTVGSSYAVQLIDGTEAAGKVLVSQTSTGKANWGTQLSGSYGLTGSLSFPSSSLIEFSSNNVNFTGRMIVSNLPNPIGTSTISSALYNYGALNEGLYIQFGDSADQGGIKITDDGVAVFGGGDEDLFKVIDEDSQLQVFAINNSTQVGINKPTTPGAQTPMNANLDVNGNAIITGSLTVTGNLQGDGGVGIDVNTMIQASLLYLSNNF